MEKYEPVNNVATWALPAIISAIGLRCPMGRYACHSEQLNSRKLKVGWRNRKQQRDDWITATLEEEKESFEKRLRECIIKAVSLALGVNTMHRRIVVDPNICHGKPTIKGTRIMVANILSLLAGGYDLAQILDYYPEPQEEGVKAAIEYALSAIGEQEIILTGKP